MHKQLRRITASGVLAAFITGLSAPSLLAVDGKNAQYLGGTLPIAENAEGKLDTTGPAVLVFRGEKGKSAGAVEIPYAAVTELEYGQKAGRRVGAAIGLALINPIGLVTLFSKKRKHYLTISYTDATGTEQAGVFELGKDIIRTTLKVVETRSGKAILYQDEDARKSGASGK